MYHEFTNKLSFELNDSLPGYDSQMLMAPKGRMPIKRFEEKQNIKKSAVLILLHPDKENIYISLIKRVTDGSKHSGQIALPGGKFEKEDTNITETALRETEEEIGQAKIDEKAGKAQYSRRDGTYSCDL